MSEKRVYLSGALKRKRKEDKKEKEESFISQNKNLLHLGFTKSTINYQSDSDMNIIETADGLCSDSQQTSVVSKEAEMLFNSEGNQEKYNSDAIHLIHPQASQVAEATEVENQNTILNIEELSQDARGSRKVEFSNDCALWTNISDNIREFWIRKGSNDCQHHDDDFAASERFYPNGRNRKFSRYHLYRKHLTGEKILRSWLLYSPTSGSIFCFACRLFNANSKSAFASDDGFSDWNHLTACISQHENSHCHREAMLTLAARQQYAGRIDGQMELEFTKERDYWRNILKRIVAVIKFLAERGLAFRGNNELINSSQNGNYLGVLQLLSQFDPLLSNHIDQYGNQGKGRASYLSSTICEEFIELMGEKLLQVIAKEIKEEKYYSVSVDSTPDLSHVDQLTVIIRYVEKSSHQATERFLKFLPLESHTGETLTNTLLDFLNEIGVDISNCRGQSYDNAANMSGRYNGMQAKIKEKNPLAHFIPCAAHSLNLIGTSAAECCVDAVNFFGIVQKLYNFFSASTSRWAVMERCLGSKKLVLKSLSQTRWSARADTIKALSDGYKNIIEALTCLAGDDQKLDTRREANDLLQQLSFFETVFLIEMWNDLLQPINKTNIYLQKANLELGTAVELLKTLKQYICSQRENFEKFETQAKIKDPETRYKNKNKRKKFRKKFEDDGPAAEENLEIREKFRVESYLPIIDKLSVELDSRTKAYDTVYNLFGVLTEFWKLSPNDVAIRADLLQQHYQDDLESSFSEELQHFRLFIQNYIKSKNQEDNQSVQNLYNLLFDLNLGSSFPNIEVAFRIYLSLMVCNASGERTFSKLKLIKNELRTCMLQKRLNSLSLMSIESELLKQIDVDDVINNFILTKRRKINI